MTNDPVVDSGTVQADPVEETAAPGGTSDRAAGVGGLKALVNMSRRRFLAAGSIGVAAAGVAAAVPGLGGLLAEGESDAPAVSGSASAAAAAAPEVQGEAAGVSQQIVAHISDVNSGEMRIFAGNQTFALRDPALASRLAQAAKAAGG